MVVRTLLTHATIGLPVVQWTTNNRIRHQRESMHRDRIIYKQLIVEIYITHEISMKMKKRVTSPETTMLGHGPGGMITNIMLYQQS